MHPTRSKRIEHEPPHAGRLVSLRDEGAARRAAGGWSERLPCALGRGAAAGVAVATAEAAAGAVLRGGGEWGGDVTEDRLSAVDQLDEGSGDFFDEGVGQGAEGEGAVEAAPGRGPVLKFVGGAEGAAEVVGTSGELGGDGAAPLLRALEVESDFDEAGFPDGPDLVVEMGVGEVQLE